MAAHCRHIDLRSLAPKGVAAFPAWPSPVVDLQEPWSEPVRQLGLRVLPRLSPLLDCLVQVVIRVVGQRILQLVVEKVGRLGQIDSSGIDVVVAAFGALSRN